MKREEKNAQSREKIMGAALEEFGDRGYEGASVNAICERSCLSKGLIYHYFEDKDHLYLECVRRCFQDMTAELSKAKGELDGEAEQMLVSWFQARSGCFRRHPEYLGVFSEAMFAPPKGLRGEVEKIRGQFDQLNIDVLEMVISRGRLRGCIQRDRLIQDFRLYMDFFNMSFGGRLRDEGASEELLQEHEDMCARQVDILLHGILEREGKA